MRAALKLTALLLLMLAIIPCHCALRLFGGMEWRSANFWHRIICRVLCIEVECVGTPLTGRQVVFVGNHLSYLDVPVVGSLAPGRFVAKADVQAWPLFGFLATLQRTVFVSRRSRDAFMAIRAMDDALHGGDNLILFPEGTSSAGDGMIAFKSSAFSAPARYVRRGALIQPFSINLERVDRRLPRTLRDRNLYAYYDDMQLPGHLWRFLQTRGARVRLVFHPPLAAADGGQRKFIAAAAARVVSSGISAIASQRSGPPTRPTSPGLETVP